MTRRGPSCSVAGGDGAEVAPVGREGQSRLWDRREVTTWVKRLCRQEDLALASHQEPALHGETISPPHHA